MKQENQELSLSTYFKRLIAIVTAISMVLVLLPVNSYALSPAKVSESDLQALSGTIEAKPSASTSIAAKPTSAQDITTVTKSTNAIDAFPDAPTPDLWSYNALKSAVDNGIMSGHDDGTLDPDGATTRAELVTMMIRMFGATEQADISAFTDIPSYEWYVQNMSIGYGMKLVSGTTETTMSPSDPVTREQAFTVISRALKMSSSDTTNLNTFPDHDLVSPYAVPYAAAFVNNGIIRGNDGYLNPLNTITRAELAQIFYNLFGSYIKSAGVYTGEIDSSVIISCADVTLKDMTIDGSLIIAEGVGNGEVTLDNVSVSGSVIVRGGGANSIKIINGSSIGDIVIAKTESGQLRVYCDDGSRVDIVRVDDGNDDIKLEGTFRTVEVQSDTKIVLANANISELNIVAEASDVTLESGTVATINLSETAVNSELNTADGTKVGTINAEANAVINTQGTVQETNVSEGVELTGDNSVTNPETKQSSSSGSGSGSSGSGSSGNSGSGSGTGTGSGSGSGSGTTDPVTPTPIKATVTNYSEFKQAVLNDSVKEIIVNGNVRLDGAGEIELGGKTITINDGAELCIASYSSLKLFSEASASSSITNKGTIRLESGDISLSSGASIANSGELAVNGGYINIQADAELNNTGSINFEENYCYWSSIDCCGKFSNTGIICLASSSTLYLFADAQGKGTMINGGQLSTVYADINLNDGAELINNGTVSIMYSNLIIDSVSSFTNSRIFSNQGRIGVYGKLNNTGIFSQSEDGYYGTVHAYESATVTGLSGKKVYVHYGLNDIYKEDGTVEQSNTFDSSNISSGTIIEQVIESNCATVYGSTGFANALAAGLNKYDQLNIVTGDISTGEIIGVSQLYIATNATLKLLSGSQANVNYMTVYGKLFANSGSTLNVDSLYTHNNGSAEIAGVTQLNDLNLNGNSTVLCSSGSSNKVNYLNVGENTRMSVLGTIETVCSSCIVGNLDIAQGGKWITGYWAVDIAEGGTVDVAGVLESKSEINVYSGAILQGTGTYTVNGSNTNIYVYNNSTVNGPTGITSVYYIDSIDHIYNGTDAPNINQTPNVTLANGIKLNNSQVKPSARVYGQAGFNQFVSYASQQDYANVYIYGGTDQNVNVNSSIALNNLHVCDGVDLTVSNGITLSVDDFYIEYGCKMINNGNFIYNEDQWNDVWSGEFINNGTATFNSSTWWYGNSSLTNNGTLEIGNSQSFSISQFINTGTVKLASYSSLYLFGNCDYTNSGTIEASKATVTVDDASTLTNTGTIRLNHSTLAIHEACTFTNTNNLTNNGTIYIYGTFSNTGTYTSTETTYYGKINAYGGASAKGLSGKTVYVYDTITDTFGSDGTYIASSNYDPDNFDLGTNIIKEIQDKYAIVYGQTGFVNALAKGLSNYDELDLYNADISTGETIGISRVVIATNANLKLLSGTVANVDSFSVNGTLSIDSGSTINTETIQVNDGGQLDIAGTHELDSLYLYNGSIANLATGSNNDIGYLYESNNSVLTVDGTLKASRFNIDGTININQGATWNVIDYGYLYGTADIDGSLSNSAKFVVDFGAKLQGTGTYTQDNTARSDAGVYVCNGATVQGPTGLSVVTYEYPTGQDFNGTDIPTIEEPFNITLADGIVLNKVQNPITAYIYGQAGFNQFKDYISSGNYGRIYFVNSGNDEIVNIDCDLNIKELNIDGNTNCLIADGATVTVEWLEIYSQSMLTNNGILNVTGNLYNWPCNLINNGKAVIKSNGIRINSNQVLENNGTLDISSSTLYVYGTVKGTGTFITDNARFYVSPGSSVLNPSGITVYKNGDTNDYYYADGTVQQNEELPIILGEGITLDDNGCGTTAYVYEEQGYLNYLEQNKTYNKLVIYSNNGLNINSASLAAINTLELNNNINFTVDAGQILTVDSLLLRYGAKFDNYGTVTIKNRLDIDDGGSYVDHLYTGGKDTIYTNHSGANTVQQSNDAWNYLSGSNTKYVQCEDSYTALYGNIGLYHGAQLIINSSVLANGDAVNGFYARYIYIGGFIYGNQGADVTSENGTDLSGLNIQRSSDVTVYSEDDFYTALADDRYNQINYYSTLILSTDRTISKNIHVSKLVIADDAKLTVGDESHWTHIYADEVDVYGILDVVNGRIGDSDKIIVNTGGAVNVAANSRIVFQNYVIDGTVTNSGELRWNSYSDSNSLISGSGSIINNGTITEYISYDYGSTYDDNINDLITGSGRIIKYLNVSVDNITDLNTVLNDNNEYSSITYTGSELVIDSSCPFDVIDKPLTINNGLKINSGCSLTVSKYLYVNNGLTVDGVMNLNGSSGASQQNDIWGDITVNGSVNIGRHAYAYLYSDRIQINGKLVMDDAHIYRAGSTCKLTLDDAATISINNSYIYIPEDTDVHQNCDVTIDRRSTLNIAGYYELNSKLVNKGTICVYEGAELCIQPGGNLVNESNIENQGTITINAGSTSADDGKLNNDNGTITGYGTIQDNTDAGLSGRDNVEQQIRLYGISGVNELISKTGSYTSVILNMNGETATIDAASLPAIQNLTLSGNVTLNVASGTSISFDSLQLENGANIVNSGNLTCSGACNIYSGSGYTNNTGARSVFGSRLYIANPNSRYVQSESSYTLFSNGAEFSDGSTLVVNSDVNTDENVETGFYTRSYISFCYGDYSNGMPQAVSENGKDLSALRISRCHSSVDVDSAGEYYQAMSDEYVYYIYFCNTFDISENGEFIKSSYINTLRVVNGTTLVVSSSSINCSAVFVDETSRLIVSSNASITSSLYNVAGTIENHGTVTLNISSSSKADSFCGNGRIDNFGTFNKCYSILQTNSPEASFTLNVSGGAITTGSSTIYINNGAEFDPAMVDDAYSRISYSGEKLTITDTRSWNKSVDIYSELTVSVGSSIYTNKQLYLGGDLLLNGEICTVWDNEWSEYDYYLDSMPPVYANIIVNYAEINGNLAVSGGGIVSHDDVYLNSTARLILNDADFYVYNGSVTQDCELTIPAGCRLIIRGDYYLNAKLTNYGQIIILDDGYLEAADASYIVNYGKIINNGDFRVIHEDREYVFITDVTKYTTTYSTATDLEVTEYRGISSKHPGESILLSFTSNVAITADGFYTDLEYLDTHISRAVSATNIGSFRKYENLAAGEINIVPGLMVTNCTIDPSGVNDVYLITSETDLYEITTSGAITVYTTADNYQLDQTAAYDVYIYTTYAGSDTIESLYLKRK